MNRYANAGFPLFIVFARIFYFMSFASLFKNIGQYCLSVRWALQPQRYGQWIGIDWFQDKSIDIHEALVGFQWDMLPFEDNFIMGIHKGWTNIQQSLFIEGVHSFHNGFTLILNATVKITFRFQYSIQRWTHKFISAVQRLSKYSFEHHWLPFSNMFTFDSTVKCFIGDFNRSGSIDWL